jgi:hypothetical protein
VVFFSRPNIKTVGSTARRTKEILPYVSFSRKICKGNMGLAFFEIIQPENK